MSKKYPNSLNLEYSVRASTYEDYAQWGRDPLLLRTIRQAVSGISSDAVCLDLCGGTGTLASWLKDESIGSVWYNLDESHAMLDQTPDGIAKVLGSAEHLPFPNKMFDLVLIRSAFDYLDFPKALLEISRILNGEGVLVVAQKTSDTYADYLGWLRRMQALRNPRKSAPMSSSDICKILLNNRFSVVESKNIETIQRYKLTDWTNRRGTIPKDRADKIEALLSQTPDFLFEDTGISIRGDHISYPTSWVVITAKPNCETLQSCAMVASALVFKRKDNEVRVLLQRRHTEALYWGFWELPQGHLRTGESLAEAAMRELSEEAGIVGRPILGIKWPEENLDPLNISRRMYLFEPREGHYFVAAPVLMEYCEGSENSHRKMDFMWSTFAEIREMLTSERFYPPNEWMLRDLLVLQPDFIDLCAS